MGQSVAIDPSMEDWIPRCRVCDCEVAEWRDALLIATSSIGPYDEADGVAVIHRQCPSRGQSV